jgi:SAM-dependent methyltransferase
MTITTEPTTHEPTAEEFAERMLGAVLGTQEVMAAYLGDRLGWYRSLADHGPATSAELAERTGTAERYAREWLEHQAAAGWVTVDDPAKPATQRRFTLPAGHAEVLVDEMSLNYMAPIARLVAAVGPHLGALVEVYRTGGGLSWATLGDEAREAQAAQNRPLFLRMLGEYLAQVPAIDTRLRAGGRVADIGCGFGWSSIGIALAYPDVTVDGYDLDAPSIEAARRNAFEAGVADRVRFHAIDAATVDDQGYDLVTAFECIHDMSDPVGVLTSMRRLAGDDGVVMVMDERAAESFQGQAADEIERLLYGFSLTCCLPDGMSHPPAVGTGTVMRPSTLAEYAKGAGLPVFEVLPIEHDFFRFYRLQ